MLKDMYEVGMGAAIVFRREIIAAGCGAALMLLCQAAGGM